MAMIEPELSFLEMQVERVPRHPVELDQPALGIAPETLDAVDMHRAARKFVVAMIDPKMLVKAHINQAVIATPAIGVDDAGDVSAPPNDGLQCAFGGIRDDLGVDAVTALEQAKDDGLAASAAPAQAAHPAWAEVRLIGFELTAQRRDGFTVLGQAATHAQINGVDRAHRDTTELGAVCGRQIHRKVAQYLPGFGRTDF